MQENQVRSLDEKDPWRRKWQPTPVFFPGESCGQRRLEGIFNGVARLGHNLATKLGFPHSSVGKESACNARDPGSTAGSGRSAGEGLLLLLLLSRFSRVWLRATPETAAHKAPLSLGFSRQKHWSEFPFPSPIHESEKWRGSVVANS